VSEEEEVAVDCCCERGRRGRRNRNGRCALAAVQEQQRLRCRRGCGELVGQSTLRAGHEVLLNFADVEGPIVNSDQVELT
jgi:hypothetical protein